MTVYDKVEKLFEEKIDETPSWAEEIIKELKAIRQLLSKTDLLSNKTVKSTKKPGKDYFIFLRNFRKRMSPNPDKDIYPEIEYKGKILGVNNNGYLYDKKTLKTLPGYEAFEIFEYFYKKEKGLLSEI